MDNFHLHAIIARTVLQGLRRTPSQDQTLVFCAANIWFSSLHLAVFQLRESLSNIWMI
uniref:Uncharacterized protein n=1 Tax=Heterorhabditis bacteriophora TaxID=37862 RepID=A0A1I7WJG7_HETBA